MQEIKRVRIDRSNRHVHLTAGDLEVLFGAGYELVPKRRLSKTGPAFAAEETVTIAGPKGQIENVRILGPCRDYTQVEILYADCFRLGVEGFVRCSEDTQGTAALRIIHKDKVLEISEGCIVAKRHIHIGKNIAKKLQLKDGDLVSVKTEGERGLVFDNTVIRISGDPDGLGTMHIDVEEANAALVNDGDQGTILI